jgi:hypothetical protein
VGLHYFGIGEHRRPGFGDAGQKLVLESVGLLGSEVLPLVQQELG